MELSRTAQALELLGCAPPRNPPSRDTTLSCHRSPLDATGSPSLQHRTPFLPLHSAPLRLTLCTAQLSGGVGAACAYSYPSPQRSEAPRSGSARASAGICHRVPLLHPRQSLAAAAGEKWRCGPGNAINGSRSSQSSSCLRYPFSSGSKHTKRLKSSWAAGSGSRLGSLGDVPEEEEETELAGGNWREVEPAAVPASKVGTSPAFGPSAVWQDSVGATSAGPGTSGRPLRSQDLPAGSQSQPRVLVQRQEEELPLEPQQRSEAQDSVQAWREGGYDSLEQGPPGPPRQMEQNWQSPSGEKLGSQQAQQQQDWQQPQQQDWQQQQQVWQQQQDWQRQEPQQQQDWQQQRTQPQGLQPQLVQQQGLLQGGAVEESVAEQLQVGMGLLSEGRGGLEGSLEIGLAEELLSRAVSEFEKAYEMDPYCLVALGQSGNALLALGELKLKAARLLRTELRLSTLQALESTVAPARRTRGWPTKEERQGQEDGYFILKDASVRESESEESDGSESGSGSGRGEGGFQGLEEDSDLQRAEAAAVVDRLADECEEALVEAGRRYRAALTLDNKDARALYNWGLALCYRAQLVMDEADEGYEELADRMLRAAIDKFEAMMTLTDKWRPGALHNIGLAQRDRARLRPLRSPERLQLVKEGRGYLRDALRWDPSNGQLRAAVSACTVELEKLTQLAQEERESVARQQGQRQAVQQQTVQGQIGQGQIWQGQSGGGRGVLEPPGARGGQPRRGQPQPRDGGW